MSTPTVTALPGAANPADAAPSLLAMVAGLVPSIHAVNRQWKAAQERLGPSHPEARALRDLKHELQLRLVALAAPYAWLDPVVPEVGEEGLEVVGLRLRVPLLGHPHCEGYRDAAHIPLDDEARPVLAALIVVHELPRSTYPDTAPAGAYQPPEKE